MIRSFADKRTQRVWERKHVPAFGMDLFRTSHRKLLLIDAAVNLEDLKIPPGNRLEALKGNRAGQHSIRVNSQWRICFRWSDAGAENVQLVDYH